MDRTTRRVLCAAALALVFAASTSFAQQPQTVRVRGVIEKVDGDTFGIKARNGEALTVKLVDPGRTTAMVKATLADIKVGSFVGVTAMPRADGSQKAIAIHIFMDSQKGVVADRHMPWDREPGSTMTNAIVDTSVAGVDGQTLMVKYKDGEKRVIVPPNTTIVAYAPGNKSELKQGTHVFIVAATKQPDGSLTTQNISYGRDGIVPPM